MRRKRTRVCVNGTRYEVSLVQSVPDGGEVVQITIPPTSAETMGWTWMLLPEVANALSDSIREVLEGE